MYIDTVCIYLVELPIIIRILLYVYCVHSYISVTFHDYKDIAIHFAIVLLFFCH